MKEILNTFLERIVRTFSTNQESDLLDFVIIISTAIIASAILTYILELIIAKVASKLVEKSKTSWDDVLYQKKVFRSLAFIAPIIIFRISTIFVTGKYVLWITTITNIYVVCIFTIIINRILNSINLIYESYPISKNRPIKGLLQAFRILVIGIASVLIISILKNESPVVLMVAIGTYTAVIMLIFKDTILGLVAGIQLTTNNMVKIGDWIMLKDKSADGTVTDISLITVTIQNWDKTISSVPAYNLISNTFTNWRGMEESEGRRIKRSINIDIDTIHFLTKEEITQLQKSDILSKYIDKMLNSESVDGETKSTLDKGNLTNLGIFRQYLELWIKANQDINKSMTNMVRQLQPTPTGIPLEIYCFTYKQDWVSYEVVQSDLFDHIISIMPEFNLKIYQYKGVTSSTQN